tara:strand:- start:1075 stop:1335 length:261 start_codon:yes stop_codon:yes gene_type:complete
VSKELEKRIAMLEDKVKMLGAVQNGLVDCLTQDNEELQGSIMASMFSIDSIRKEFTEYVNKDADDDTKAFMMYVNELVIDMDKGVA